MGICIVSPAAFRNAGRNKVFGRSDWSGKQLNQSFCNISRIVIDPRYRGAGIAGDFLKAVVLRCPTRWVEMVTTMGIYSKFHQKAGFVDYGMTDSRTRTEKHSDLYGASQKLSKKAGVVKAQSRLSTAHYYLADRNRVIKEAGSPASSS